MFCFLITKLTKEFWRQEEACIDIHDLFFLSKTTQKATKQKEDQNVSINKWNPIPKNQVPKGLRLSKYTNVSQSNRQSPSSPHNQPPGLLQPLPHPHPILASHNGDVY